MRTKLSQFNFDLPNELVSMYPSEHRDESRLMVVHRDSGKIEHKQFKEILDYFDDGDAFIPNNTKGMLSYCYTQYHIRISTVIQPVK